MVKSVVFQGETLIGEVEIHPQGSYSWQGIREIRVAGFSSASSRCPPLAVLLCIASGGVIFKMESLSPPPSPDGSPLSSMHAACLRENKTAVVQLEGEEIHLVALPTRKNLTHCTYFWGFSVMPGLYKSCLAMLNLRCLGIVFDLDETLIVANTMRSFEDRIEGLQRKITKEMDQERITEMVAELKRYHDDQAILKQYIDNDQVVDNGKVYIVQPEIVPPLSDNHQLISRPVIRLQDKNIILTRVNPTIRDTSVLVRLRPAWEDLRVYLTAKGRKRFQVYVCTMAERDYALEMWRLLDPESNLINHRELLDRIVCVKSGSRKSLVGVFKDGVCHPSMALVIDDRLKVWDEKDQSRVHVVPAFAPYYTPHAEANNTIPVLCVARNVACNVRGGFFREFDEGILPRISDIFYEDEMNFPSAPDVANYLSPEDDTSMLDGIKDNPEAQRGLKDPNYSCQSVPSLVNGLEPKIISYYDHVMTPLGAVQLPTSQMIMTPNNQCLQPCASGKPFMQPVLSEPSLHGSPATEEGEVPESELDPDMRRRLLILQHGQDTRDPPPPPAPFVGRPPFQVAGPSGQSRGSSFHLDEEISPRLRRRFPNEFPIQPDSQRFSRKRFRPSFYNGRDFSDRAINENQRPPLHGHRNDDRLRLNHAVSSYNSFPGEEMPIVRNHYRDVHLGPAFASVQYSENPASVLQEIAVRCGDQVEYRTALCDTTELQFSIEAWFAGEKVGEGIGRTRREAQHQAAQASIHALANNYLSSLPDAISQRADLTKFPPLKENGFLHDPISVGHQVFTRDNYLSVNSTTDDYRFLDQNVMEGKKSTASIVALKERCTMEGSNLVFHSPPSLSSDSESQGEMHAQVEVAGQILSMGNGTTWEEAKFKRRLLGH